MDDNNDDLFAEVRRIMEGAKASLVTDQEEQIVLMAKTCERAWTLEDDKRTEREHELYVAVKADGTEDNDPNSVTLDPNDLQALEDQSNVARLRVSRAMGTDDQPKFITALTDLNATIAMEHSMDPLAWIVRTHGDNDSTFSVYVTAGGVLLCRRDKDGEFQTFWSDWDKNNAISIPDDLSKNEANIVGAACRGFVLPKELAATFPRAFALLAMEAVSNIKDSVERRMESEDDDN